MFSVFLIARNEEKDLPECLKRLAWCDDILLIDDFSTDRTAEIARSAGCRVIQRKFDTFADQRNFGLDHGDFKHDWVFHLDADEWFTEELRQECEEIILKDEIGAWLVPSKMLLHGKWLRHAATYPVYQMRFHKIGDARFEQVGHGQRECGLKRGLGTMQTPYLHNGYSKGLSDWFRKHNRYSSEEAVVAWHDRSVPVNWKAVLGGCGVDRRRNLKILASHLPGRWILRFFYMYLWRMGFLDGRAGLDYCLMQMTYELMVSLKLREIRISRTAEENE